MGSRKHFHTFDALRFFAFMKVFLLHLPITAFPVFSFLKGGGGIGVSFFFVLSGFLITYIILEEKSNTGTINLKNFFVRRILRIWPLFYLMILIAFLTPHLLSFFGISASPDGYQPNWLISCLFLENYNIMFSHSEPNVSPLGVMWSLCVEEHFYFIWGLAMFFIKMKKIPVLLIAAIITGSIARGIYLANTISDADVFSNIDYFAWGAIPAYLLVTNAEKFVNATEKIHVSYKIFFAVLVVCYVILSPNIDYNYKSNIEPLLFGAMFSALLSIIIPANSPLKIADKNILSYLGVFTYGLYVYHTIIINAMTHVFNMLSFSLDKAGFALLFSFSSLLITIGVSIVSYHVFEKHFLKLKKLFY